MRIKGFVKTSLVDYPGNIASAIFLFGCNFRCGYCHNLHMVKGGGGRVFSEKEILDYLKRQKKNIDGVCVSGGEPTLYTKELPPFLSKIKKIGLKIKLDTNGSNPKFLKDLIDNSLVDYVALDVKAPLEKYNLIIGKKMNTDKILETIKALLSSGIDYEFRTTAVPILKKEDFLVIAKMLAGAKRYYLQQFRNSTQLLDSKYEELKPYTKDELEEIRLSCQKIVPTFLRL